MDIRREVVGILVGGSPAPGVNSAISAAAIEAINSNCIVIGFLEGQKHLKAGHGSQFTNIDIADMVGIYSKGGSFLKTSKEQLKTDIEVDNALRVLQHHRVRYLITIGGTDTARSARILSDAAKKAADYTSPITEGNDYRSYYKLSVVHVPKTIFSDLPLVQDARTFGYSTARSIGANIVGNLLEDARTMGRYYIVTVIGSKAGHLALGIGKSSAATLTLIPEEFANQNLTFNHIVNHIDACLIKREAIGKFYGVVLVAEGLVDKMDPSEVRERFESVDKGHEILARSISNELLKRRQQRKYSELPRIVSQHIGFELRASDPDATDRELARDLGYGAMHDLLDGGSDHMVTMKGENMAKIPFCDPSLFDSRTGQTNIKLVDTKSLAYEVATKYMIRLRREDLKNSEIILGLSHIARTTPEQFVKNFSGVAK